jgi:hypothetical protein
MASTFQHHRVTKHLRMKLMNLLVVTGTVMEFIRFSLSNTTHHSTHIALKFYDEKSVTLKFSSFLTSKTCG